MYTHTSEYDWSKIQKSTLPLKSVASCGTSTMRISTLLCFSHQLTLFLAICFTPWWWYSPDAAKVATTRFGKCTHTHTRPCFRHGTAVKWPMLSKCRRCRGTSLRNISRWLFYSMRFFVLSFLLEPMKNRFLIDCHQRFDVRTQRLMIGDCFIFIAWGAKPFSPSSPQIYCDRMDVDALRLRSIWCRGSWPDDYEASTNSLTRTHSCRCSVPNSVGQR